MTELAKLKALAEAARGERPIMREWMAYTKAFTPDVILALIAEIEEATDLLARAKPYLPYGGNTKLHAGIDAFVERNKP